MNKNSHIWIGSCVVSMVTALDHIGHVLTKKFTLIKNKRVWFSGAGESIQMRFIQMVEQLSQFTKFAIKEFWVL